MISLGDAQTQNATGRTLTKREGVIADKSAAIKITLWENQTQKVQVSKSYQFQNVTVRLWDNKKFLSTSVSTIINEIPDIGPLPAQNLDDLQDSKQHFSIISVSCKLTKQCLACKAEITSMNPELTTYKCTSCLMRQNVSTIVQGYKCDIIGNLNSVQRRLLVPARVLASCDVTKSLQNCDDIEDVLLKSKEIEITVSGNSVTSMEINTDSEDDL